MNELSDTVYTILKHCNTNRFVSKKGIECRVWSKKYRPVERCFSRDGITESLAVNEIPSVYDLNINCSCENVLWAIGAFRVVNEVRVVGYKQNEGLLEVFDEKYANHVKSR